MTEDKYKRRRREQERVARRLKLYDTIALQAELLCDSHWKDDDKLAEILGRMHKALVEVMRKKPDEVSRKALAAIFDQCKWHPDQTTHISLDGNLLKLHGDFDVKELAKRLVWIDVAENEKIVEDEEEEYR